jgi:thiol-disulfide isomerase/thioredoxin
VLPVIIGGVVVLCIVAIVAVVLSGGDKSDNSTTTPSGVAQTRPVRVEGSALPGFDSNASTDPAVGTSAPTLVGQNFAGTRVAIGNDGRAKALVFVAHWCPHCQREVPRIARYLSDQGLPDGVDLYFVATSTTSQGDNYPPSTWLQREGVGRVPTIADDAKGTAFTAFGGESFPYFVFVDKDGKVVARRAGEVEQADLPALFTALANGSQIPGAPPGASSASPS